MKRWLAVLLLMFGGLGAEAVQPGPCRLIANTGRSRRDGHNTDDDPKSERRRRIF